MSFETKHVEHEDMNQNSELQEKRDFLLSQEKFELLMNIQREIEAETEMRPTFKKLINALVTEETLSTVKQRLIEQMS